MTNGQDGDRLSWGDALFLYLERAGMPLNIASISLFEGEIPLNKCTRFIASKIPLLPRYCQRVVSPPWNIGFPTWEFDPEFNITNHIREITLTKGTEADLKAVTGQIFSKVMDREQPLWDLTLVRGLRDHRTGMILRIHHCLADGIAGIGLMNVLMDPSPEPRPLPPVKKQPSHNRGRRNQQRRDSWTRFLDGILSSNSDNIQRVLASHSDLLDISERMAAAKDDFSLDKIGRFLPEITAPTERLFFNRTYQGPQKFAWAQVPVSEIKAIRDWSGSTHNDVVLALMTATIRRYAELHGERVRGRLLRLMVPVNVRGNGSPGDLGNRISMLPVTVPLGIRNPRKLLAAVHERTEFLKRSNFAQMVGLAGGLLGLVPAPLQALVGPLASLLPITPCNLICTNLKGPQAPLYLLGHKMLDWYPYVPVGGEMALNCAILSYNGITYFGFSGDVHAAPDLGRLESLLRLSFAELRQAAGLESTPRKKAAKSQPSSMPGPESSSGSSPVSRSSVAARQPPAPTAVTVAVAAD